jgi:signal transduction histidine kinase
MAKQVRHEIKNYLNDISMQLFSIKTKEESKIYPNISLIVQNLNDIGNLLNFQFTFFNEINRVKCNIQHLIEGVAFNLLTAKINESNIKVSTKFDLVVPELYIDEFQFRIVFYNLIKNACEAMPEGGDLRIETYYESQSGEAMQDNVIVKIQDTGCGIPEDVKKKIFDEGVTTKARGLGYGLYNVKNIVTRHGGQIEVFSQLNKGTTFVITIPVISPEEGS